MHTYVNTYIRTYMHTYVNTYTVTYIQWSLVITNTLTMIFLYNEVKVKSQVLIQPL